ncbi:MAG: glycine oxidase ThiO [Gammaproteobacteria bacterium]|nr:glycine oxidase ThiO [Gammaproteobacteria bacterium]
MSDFLVIGGGVIGMLTARELRRAGAEVTLLERQQIGQESSWAGGGILSPLHPWRYADAVTALARWSQQQYPALVDELHDSSGIDPQWLQSGLLFMDLDEQVHAQQWASRCGVALDVLEGTELLACEPALAKAERRALWMPDIAQVRNPRLLKALRPSLIAQGVTIEEAMPVQRLLINDHRVQGVETAAGIKKAQQVVVACGAWSQQLMPSGLALDVEPVRGQMLLFRTPPGTVSRIILKHGYYVIPRSDGRVLVGSTVEYVGYDKATTRQAFDTLRAAATDIVPALADCEIERHWAGLRPGSHDGVPTIARHPDIAGLYVNAGHFRNGVVLGPASARLLSDLALGRTPIVDPLPYRMAC